MSPCRYLDISSLGPNTFWTDTFMELRDIEVHNTCRFFSVQCENWLMVEDASCHKVSQDFHILVE